MKTRREALKTMFLIGGALAAGPFPSLHAQTPARKAADAISAAGPFELPSLGFEFDALEPFIDAKTMQIHHGKHHASYVEKLNAAIAQAPAEAQKKSIEELLRNIDELPEKIRLDVRNQGGGHANHSLFWQTLKKNQGSKPTGELARAIDKAFGSFDGFQQKFETTASKVFGSGWAWLVADKEKMLSVEPSANQDSPLMKGLTPLLGIDVWEHAYYLKYQNRRPEYIEAFRNVVNWDFVSERYAKL